VTEETTSAATAAAADGPSGPAAGPNGSSTPASTAGSYGRSSTAERARRASTRHGTAGGSGGSSTREDTAPQVPDTGTQDQVNIRMPADGAYLSVLRTATAGLAARLDFNLDDIEDLRIAVDEACAMLLGQAVPGSNLECSFTLSPDEMSITVSVPSLNPRPPSGDTFAWTVLSALAGSVAARVGPGDKLAIVLRKSRPEPGSV
jgi:serine/threonine-protein kinase RsbW